MNTAPLKNSTAMVKSPKVPPAIKAKRTYADFDHFVACADWLGNFFDQVIATSDRLLDDDKATRFDLQHAQNLVANFPEARRRLGKFKDSEGWYNRKELYENNYGTISRRVVSESVGLLLGAFPNSNPADGKVFTRMLIEEIIVANPNACVLESACRHIRRTMKFVPTIAEVLSVLKKETTRWVERWETTDGEVDDTIDYWRKMLERHIAEATARLEAIAAGFGGRGKLAANAIVSHAPSPPHPEHESRASRAPP